VTKNQEKQLALLARKAATLRETISTSERMMAQWRERRNKTGKCYVSFSSRDMGLDAGGYMTSEIAERELIPALVRIRNEARAELKALDLP
jgi:hypothetical protein